MRVRINEEKFEELKDKLRPGRSWWALLGIVVFFFLPEIAAYFYGAEIKHFFALKASSAGSFLQAKLYGQLESLGENSFLNITVGVLFTIWFFKSRGHL